MHQNSMLALKIQFNQADQISSFIDSWNQMTQKHSNLILIDEDENVGKEKP